MIALTGEAARGDPRRAGGAFHDRLRGRLAAGRRQAGRAGRAPGARQPHGHAVAGADGSRGGRRPRAPRNRSPARQGHFRAAGRREERRRLRSATGRLQAREVRREYPRWSRAARSRSSGTIDAPLGRDRRSPDVIAVRIGLAARCRHPLRGARGASGHTPCCDVTLETGRTHQIRAHLAAIGLPVSGDPHIRRRRRVSASTASSCTPAGSSSTIPSAASTCASSRRCRRISTRRWRPPARSTARLPVSTTRASRQPQISGGAEHSCRTLQRERIHRSNRGHGIFNSNKEH